MEKFGIFLVFLSFAFSMSVCGQDAQYDKALSLRGYTVDFPSYFDSELRSLDKFDYGLALDYTHNYGSFISSGIGLQYAVVDRYIDENATWLLDEQFYSMDVFAKFQLFNHERRFNADAQIGLAGFTHEFESFHFQLPFAINAYVKLLPKLHLQIQPMLRWSPEKHTGSIQVGAGLIYLFGQDIVPTESTDFMPDSDGDGILDFNDDCPAAFGIKELQGCPDADADGVSDIEDLCPNVVGLKSNGGCPDPSRNDQDGDGVKDKDDSCPETPGLRRNNGCPDRDMDGVIDSQDLCPDIFGTFDISGCPDTDGDGIHDGMDACPELFGDSSQGCPQIDVDTHKELSDWSSKITFETNSSQLSDEAKGILKELYSIIIEYPNYPLMIEGHTDHVGAEDRNLDLSENRAKACYAYLVELGVSPSQLRYQGFGESRPIASNDSSTGRAKNRRVVIKFLE